MITITEKNFVSEVENSDRLTIIDFWAAWCGPCKMLSPVFQELSEEFPEVKFCKVNVDEQRELAKKFGIGGIPTLVFMLDGNIAETVIGYRAKEELAQLIKDYT